MHKEMPWLKTINQSGHYHKINIIGRRNAKKVIFYTFMIDKIVKYLTYLALIDITMTRGHFRDITKKSLLYHKMRQLFTIFTA